METFKHIVLEISGDIILVVVIFIILKAFEYAMNGDIPDKE